MYNADLRDCSNERACVCTVVALNKNDPRNDRELRGYRSDKKAGVGIAVRYFFTFN